MTTALITGITGQDGSYLAEFLLEKGYTVRGMVRRHAASTRQPVPGVELVDGDMLDHGSITAALEGVDEVYNLAAQSFVGSSWRQPVYTAEVTGLGALRVLETIRETNPNIRFYQASSSEMFGNEKPPQHEFTRLAPRSPYGVAKVFAHHTTINYRESHGIFAVAGILFNHESPRRGPEFVTQKIATAAARGEKVTLGNLDAKRDWGFAGDYVRAMWLMLQQDEPKDYVIATGVTHSVADFAKAAYARVGLNWREFVGTDPAFRRPAEVDELRGDPTLAMIELGWKPTVKFHDLVNMMVDAAL